MLAKTSKDGMRIRPNFEEIQDYLDNKQQTVTYPNRDALRIRNSHQLSNLLDGDGMGFLDLEAMQMKTMNAQEEENIIVKEAMKSNTPVAHIKAMSTQTKTLSTSASTQAKPSTNDAGTQKVISEGTSFFNLMDDAIMEEVEVDNNKKQKQTNDILKMIQTNLGVLATPAASVFAKLITQPSSSSSNQPASSSNQPMEIVEPASETVPMETVNLSKKIVYAETGTPEGPKKRGRKAKGDEVVLGKPYKSNVNVDDSGSTPEEKQHKSSIKTLPVKKKMRIRKGAI